MNPLAPTTAGTNHSSTAGFLPSVSFDLPRDAHCPALRGFLFCEVGHG